MGATKIQYGQTNYRINREPIDAESVITTYSGLVSKTGPADDAEGALYPGMIVAVTEDQDESKRGPYYISYETTSEGTAYTKDRIPLRSELDHDVDIVKEELENEIEDSVNELMFNWGHLS